MSGFWPSLEAEVPRNMREAVLLTIPIWLVAGNGRNPQRKPALTTVHLLICSTRSLLPTTNKPGNVSKTGRKWNNIERTSIF